MGRMTGIKWEKSTPCRPIHNIISSDFPKYYPQPWQLMEGPPRIELLLSNEYQRMWLEEVKAWQKRMYPENTTVSVDVVKNYVLTFKSQIAKKQKPKKLFKIKKFEEVEGKTSSKRPPKAKQPEQKS